VLFAETAPTTGGGSNFMTIGFLVLMVGAMYFLLIRPQNKRRRESMAMQSQIGPGDEVQTVGGLYATVVSVDDESVTLQAAPGVEMRYARGAIARVTNKLNSDSEDTGGPDTTTPVEKS
jgi:preprotein translocase subunit YajC